MKPHEWAGIILLPAASFAAAWGIVMLVFAII